MIKQVMEARVLEDRKIIDYNDWLRIRRQGIGGSDSSVIVGLNNYSSPYTLWADKVSLLPPIEDNEAMRQGRDLEEYVASRFVEQTNKKVRNCNYILQHKEYDYILANVDRLIVGEKAGLECKTTSSLNIKKFKNGEYPANYYVQCMHYMAVTGAKKWYLAVLVFGQGFCVYEIERDEEEIKALLEAEKDFWNNYVVTNTPPAVDGFNSTTETINTIFNVDTVQDNGQVVGLKNISALENYLALQGQIKALETKKTKCEQILKEELGEITQGECGGYKVTWNPQQRRSFDTKRFIADNPNLDLSKYYNVTNFRTFKVSEIKEK